MENRVYYGQYSLMHWIELILKKNITLPAYQRRFVWDDKKVKTLIDALKNNQFVPPITIGAFKSSDVKSGDVKTNLILDGQQRLTSILLAYVGYFPNTSKYKDKTVKIADENDSENEDEDNALVWRFDELTKIGKNKDQIIQSIENIEKANYKIMNLGIKDDFFSNTFLGFSYVVPHSEDKKEQQKYYSTVFRSINNEGKSLSAQEKRASLYYSDESLANYFAPDFFEKLIVNNVGCADFVRYMSLLSQYKKDSNTAQIGIGFKSRMESYYEKYICSVTGDESCGLFVDFETVFPQKEFKAKCELLQKAIEDVFLTKQFDSIIDLDMMLFGLIYAVIFENKSIDIARLVELQPNINRETTVFKNDKLHAKSPSTLKYLRERIDKSIKIMDKYVKIDNDVS